MIPRRPRLSLDSMVDTPVPPLTREQVSSARLFVCGGARDAADASLLLDMLGLNA